MYTISGQLAIRTIHGRNGAFKVGLLTTSVGEFTVKNAELDQYPEGKYDGDFVISLIYVKPYTAPGRVGFEHRANLAGMTLSSINALSGEEAARLSPQDIDPIDEEAQPAPTPAPAQPEKKQRKKSGALVDTTPFGSQPTPAAALVKSDDETLFGALWPLGELVKLDATVDRRKLREQRDRLDMLGYAFEPLSQDWHLKAA